jgi:hypothetical protein
MDEGTRLEDELESPQSLVNDSISHEYKQRSINTDLSPISLSPENEM